MGLVLCGGGARGAFEVGVWEALDELGITKQITGFSGTSIGAVNTALFLSNTTNKQKEDIWLSFKQKDMLDLNVDLGLKNLFLSQIFTKWGLPLAIPSLISNGIFSQKKLESLLGELNMDTERIKNADVFTSVTDLSIGHIYTAFIDWKTIPAQKIKRYVKYSAKLPIINGFQITKKVGHLIVDGGLRDFHEVLKPNLSNTPIAPLYAIGYRKFIVVYLSKEEDNKKQIQTENEWFAGAEICRIFYDGTKSLASVLTIDEENTTRRIEAGKKAVNDMLTSSKEGNLIFDKSNDGRNETTISKTLTCIQRGEKIVNGKVQYYQ